MGTQKQTNKFDVYIQFLDNLVKRNTIELNEVSNRIELYKAVSAILDKRSRGELVSNYHYLKITYSLKPLIEQIMILLKSHFQIHYYYCNFVYLELDFL